VDATEPQEPSYYEVALTNRQVLVAFVALLTCLLVAFLAGVWIGRGGAESAAAQAAPAAPAGAAPAPLEQLSFFNGSDAGAKPAAAAKPEPAPARVEAPPPAPEEKAAAPEAPDASEAMRQNLEATMAANRETPAMKMAVGERTGATAPAGETAAPAPAAAATPPAATAKPAAAVGKIFVQVYSSGNGERAREIVTNLRKAGFPVVISETPKANGRNFRVRVGPYAERAAADDAAIRLRRDHRLDTWVTDSP
jgi:DedD protein